MQVLPHIHGHLALSYSSYLLLLLRHAVQGQMKGHDQLLYPYFIFLALSSTSSFAASTEAELAELVACEISMI